MELRLQIDIETLQSIGHGPPKQRAVVLSRRFASNALQEFQETGLVMGGDRPYRLGAPRTGAFRWCRPGKELRSGFRGVGATLERHGPGEVLSSRKLNRMRGAGALVMLVLAASAAIEAQSGAPCCPYCSGVR